MPFSFLSYHIVLRALLRTSTSGLTISAVIDEARSVVCVSSLYCVLCFDTDDGMKKPATFAIPEVKFQNRRGKKSRGAGYHMLT